VYEFKEVIITAPRKPKILSTFGIENDPFATTVTAEMIEEFPVTKTSELLDRFAPGGLGRGQTSLDGIILPPLLLIDNIIMEIGDLNDINPNDIEQISVIRVGPSTSIFGLQGANGVILVFTKRGDSHKKYPPFYIKPFFPLGYQQPVEFYAPKYDTPEKQNTPTPDLRTTIHWQPVVQTDSAGEASFEFYTADEPTSYTVIIEGLANVRKERKMWWGYADEQGIIDNSAKIPVMCVNPRAGFAGKAQYLYG